jgi:Reverse transcriptase (RNA-dependent DNA polymerase)
VSFFRIPSSTPQKGGAKRAKKGRTNDHKPNVAHLKVFGSIAYGKIPYLKITKLEDKSKKYVFIRYREKFKAYNLYDPIEKKLMICRDVELNEEARWDWKNQQEELTTEEVELRLLVRNDGASSSRNSEEDSSSGSSEEAEVEPRNLRFQDLRVLYETTGEVHLVCLLADAETISFEEAVRDPKWKAALDEEMMTIEKNETWEMTDLPTWHKPIGLKWVYKKKMTPQGTIERHKARLLVKEYRQDVGSSKLQVPIPKDQELGNPDHLEKSIPKPRRQ